MAEIKVGEMAHEIAKTLEGYAGLVQTDLVETIDAVCKETAKEICMDAKVRFGGTGDYAKSWTSKKRSGSTMSYNRVVYADDPHYRLTHLLERGHDIVVVRNGARVKLGHVEGRPHIALADKKARREVERRLIEAIKKHNK